MRCAIGLLALLACPPALGQIVNVQPLVAAGQEREGFSLGVDASADFRSGNIDFLLLSGSVLPRYRAGPHLVFVMLKAEYGLQADAVFVARDFEHLRYRGTLLPWLSGEVFIQHDRDLFRRLALRALAGAGPRFEPLRSEHLTLALGIAYLLEHERLSEGPQADAGEETLHHRASTYASLTWVASEQLRAGLTAYLQPRFDRVDDVRALLDAELLLAIAGPASIRLSAGVTHDSLPPIGLEPTDIALKGALHLAW